MGFLSPSPIELLVILVIALLVLGPKRLPDTARALGRGVRELRNSLQSASEGIRLDPDDDADEELDEAYAGEGPFDDDMPAPADMPEAATAERPPEPTRES